MYLSQALGIGTTPIFRSDVVPVARVTPAMLREAVRRDPERRAASRRRGAGGTLKKFVESGGGLLVAAGDRTTWPQGEADLLPGTLGPAVDRTSGAARRSASATTATPCSRSSRRRAAATSPPRASSATARSTTGPNDRVLARFDDGAVAAAERQVGAGRVIVLTSTLDDSCNDLPVKPVYLPLVHQLVKYLAQFEQPRPG